METKEKHYRKLTVRFYVGFALFFLLVSLAVISIPTLDGPNSRRRANEAVTVGNIRRLNDLEKEYAASNPSKGFACQLSLLKPASPAGQAYDTDGFLVAESHLGYKFFFSECAASASGIVGRYQAAAIPVNPGVSGVRAFCTDQIGVIWFDDKGSAEECLASRRPIN
jgi:hypothetical protein